MIFVESGMLTLLLSRLATSAALPDGTLDAAAAQCYQTTRRHKKRQNCFFNNYLKNYSTNFQSLFECVLLERLCDDAMQLSTPRRFPGLVVRHKVFIAEQSQ
jgi:hypothetical protein